MDSMKPSKNKLARTLAKVLHFRTGIAPVDSGIEKVGIEIKKKGDKDDRNDEEEEGEESLAMEAFLAKLFASISCVKCCYAQLQFCQSPYDVDGIQMADRMVVSELKNLSELKRCYLKKQFEDDPSPRTSLVLAEIQEQKSLLKTYEITAKKLENQARLKDSEAIFLREKLDEVNKQNKEFEKKLNQSGQVLSVLDNLHFSGLNPSHFIAVLRHSVRSIRSFVRVMIEEMKTANWDFIETPMLVNAVADGAVDFKGRPVSKTNSGGWRSAAFIIGVEVAERFAYYGISSNLVTYLTGPLRQSTAAAAANVNAWTGTASLLPLLGAFVADSYLGRFRTIALASVLYILGLGLLTLSAILPTLIGFNCQTDDPISCSPPQIQVMLFFFSLYLVGAAQGGHKPCTQAFGADQFDGYDLEECKGRSSFFNWWYFGVCVGGTVAIFVVSYVQDNLSWALGFGIPCIAMVIALVVFLIGTRTYRYYCITLNEKGPFVRIGSVFVAAFKNWGTSPPTISSTEVESHEFLPHQRSEQFKFLNKALFAPKHLKNNYSVCSLNEVEEAKAVLALFPIWVPCLVYGIVLAQSPTFFTKQGATMDRTVVSGFKIPAASLQCLISLTTVIIIPIYDTTFVPIARAFTRKPAGITVLQRIGTGIFFSATSMVVAALVEIQRLNIALKYDLLDKPNVTIPMSVWWLVPQYLLSGIADCFALIGMQEFFYDQVPTELRSIGLALYLSVVGVGNFLSSFLVSIIENSTGGDGRDSWFSNNLNRAHLDYFYWLLSILSAFGFAAYLHLARSYIYKRRDAI